MKEIEVNNHKICGGKCEIHYTECGEYHVECQSCGIVWRVRAPRMIDAIGHWNTMNIRNEPARLSSE